MGGAIGEEGAVVRQAVVPTRIPTPIPTIIIAIVKNPQVLHQIILPTTNLTRKAKSTVTFQPQHPGPVLSTGVKAVELHIAQIR